MQAGIISLVSFLGCKQLVESVNTDFYTGKFVPRNKRSVEHIKPKSKGGANNISNYAMADRDVNSDRGNMPLNKWMRQNPKVVENMRNYCLKYWDLDILGVKHGQQVNKVVKNLTGINLVDKSTHFDNVA